MTSKTALIISCTLTESFISFIVFHLPYGLQITTRKNHVRKKQSANDKVVFTSSTKASMKLILQCIKSNTIMKHDTFNQLIFEYYYESFIGA